MRRKSFLAGFLSFLVSAGSIIFGYVIAAIGGIFSALINNANSSNLIITLLNVLGWVCLAGGAVGIVGSVFCVINSKIAKILLLIATVLCSALVIFLIVISFINAETPSTLIWVTLLIPIIFIIADLVINRAAKIVKDPELEKLEKEEK